MTRKNLIECQRARQVQAQMGNPLHLIEARSFALTVLAILLALILAEPARAQSSITIGDTKVESGTDSGNGNMVLAQATALSQGATIASLSFYVKKPSGNLILGLYDSTGPKGGPGKLVAATSSFATASGWNTANVTPVSLAAGTYWLAYLPSSSNLTFVKQNDSGSCAYQTQTFSRGIPTTFATSTANCTPTTWSFYATLAPSGSSESTGSSSSGTGGGRRGGGGSGGGSATNGRCGSANGAAASAAPISNLCSAGTASAVAGNGPWNWMCAGSNGGTTASCQAPVASPSPINGTCGSANGLATSTAPTANLCATGTASAVAGNGPWNWMCAGTNGGTPGSCQAPFASSGGGGGGGGGSGSGGGAGSPTLIQHVASSANPLGAGIAGNNFKVPMPNPVLAGDALVLAITYPHGNTSAITDSLGQKWPAAAITKDGGSGNNVTQIYVLCGAVAGNETITVGLTGSSLPFEYTVSEFNNVATTGCVDGSVGGTNLSPGGSAVINPGSFTPSTNNDANGGHIIWSYTAVATTATGNPSSWVPAAGFTLLDGDIAWFNKQGFPHASQWYVQSTNAAITPSIASTGDTADTFNSLAIALLAANAGGTMPSGIHVNKIVHQSWTQLSGTLNLLLPATGNLRVLAFPAGLNNINITSITDSAGGTWSLAQTAGDSAQVWYSGNQPAESNLMVSIHTSGTSPTNSVRFFDVQGASASPFDVAAGTDFVPCNSGTINNMPTISPTGANELVIATMGDGNGPGLGLASGAPNGAIWDLTTYSGEVDTDLMENADALAHVYTAAATVENWNWTITARGSNNQCSAEAVAFK